MYNFSVNLIFFHRKIRNPTWKFVPSWFFRSSSINVKYPRLFQLRSILLNLICSSDRTEFEQSRRNSNVASSFSFFSCQRSRSKDEECLWRCCSRLFEALQRRRGEASWSMETDNKLDATTRSNLTKLFLFFSILSGDFNFWRTNTTFYLLFFKKCKN